MVGGPGDGAARSISQRSFPYIAPTTRLLHDAADRSTAHGGIFAWLERPFGFDTLLRVLKPWH